MSGTNHLGVAAAFSPESLRADRVVRAVVRRWRELGAGMPDDAPTLIACSGGVDSTALALCLRAATRRLVLAHVIHDMRPAHEAHSDRDAVRRLAAALGVPIVETHAQRAPRANVEASLRAARYAALARLAADVNAPLLATAHHADDQLESVVMALVRGAGPSGLAGVAPARTLPTGVRVVRPMLGVTRADAKRLCLDAGVCWSEDATNNDRERWRNALRHGPIAQIEQMRPGASRRAAMAADLVRETLLLVEDRVREAFADRFEWARDALRRERAIVVGAGLRDAAMRLNNGAGGDRLTRRVVDPVVRAVLSDATDPKRFEWPVGVAVEVNARSVRVRRASDAR